MMMIVKMQMRLTLFTTCVNSIRYDVYDHTRVPARWSIKLSHTWPLSSILSSPWPLHFSSLLKHIYKHTEGFMKYTLTHATGERCGEPLWFVLLQIRPRGCGREKQTGLHHIKEQRVYCSHSASAETHVTFSSFKRAAVSTSSSLVCRIKQKVAVPELESLPPMTGCEYFRNPILKGFLYVWNGLLKAKFTKEIHYVLILHPVSPPHVLKSTELWKWQIRQK